jgi:DNA mismatch repair ATPase MutS
MFRPSDFYETFDDDAKRVASVCNIVLTGRDMGIGNCLPLAGVPCQALTQNPRVKVVYLGGKRW